MPRPTVLVPPEAIRIEDEVWKEAFARRERVADGAVLTEQLPPRLLRRGQLQPADLAVGVVVVADQEHERQGDAEADVDDGEDHAGRSPSTIGRSSEAGARAADPAPDRDQEHAEPEHYPEEDEQGAR